MTPILFIFINNNCYFVTLNSFLFCRLKNDKTFYRVVDDKINRKCRVSKTFNLPLDICFMRTSGTEMAIKKTLNRWKRYHRVSGVSSITRRYFVMNAFDGALTMLGVVIGAYDREG